MVQIPDPQPDGVIAAQRALYEVTAVRTKVRHFVNPALLDVFPYERRGGERRARFSALVNQAKALYVANDKIDKAKLTLEETKVRLAKTPLSSKRRPPLVTELATWTKAIAAATAKAKAGLRALLKEGERVRQKLARELQDTQDPDTKRALERASDVPVIIAIEQTQWRVTHADDGKNGGLDLIPAGCGVNTVRPQGHRHLGTADFTAGDWHFAWKSLARDEDDAVQVSRVLQRHQGKTDAVDTSDHDILTLGPGLTGSALAKMLWTLSQVEPAFFASQIASLGIGIETRDDDHVLLYKDILTGETHVAHDASAAIAADPLVLGALRRVCGMKPVREQLALRALDESFTYALDWSFTVEGPPNLLGFDGATSKAIHWRDVTAKAAEPDMTKASLAVLATQRYFAGDDDDPPGNYEAAIAKRLLARAKASGTTVAAVVNDPPTCRELVRHLIHQHPMYRRKHLTAEFPHAFS